LPSPEAARKFLYQFHSEENVEKAQKQLPPDRVSYVVESAVCDLFALPSDSDRL